MKSPKICGDYFVKIGWNQKRYQLNGIKSDDEFLVKWV